MPALAGVHQLGECRHRAGGDRSRGVDVTLTREIVAQALRTVRLPGRFQS